MTPPTAFPLTAIPIRTVTWSKRPIITNKTMMGNAQQNLECIRTFRPVDRPKRLCLPDSTTRTLLGNLT